jgi:hypothetical protein
MQLLTNQGMNHPESYFISAHDDIALFLTHIKNGIIVSGITEELEASQFPLSRRRYEYRAGTYIAMCRKALFVNKRQRYLAATKSSV